MWEMSPLFLISMKEKEGTKPIETTSILANRLAPLNRESEKGFGAEVINLSQCIDPCIC